METQSNATEENLEILLQETQNALTNIASDQTLSQRSASLNRTGAVQPINLTEESTIRRIIRLFKHG